MITSQESNTLSNQYLHTEFFFNVEDWLSNILINFNGNISEDKRCLSLKGDGFDLNTFVNLKNKYDFRVLVDHFLIDNQAHIFLFSYRWNYHLRVTMPKTTFKKKFLYNWNSQRYFDETVCDNISLFDLPYDENKSIYAHKRRKYHYLNFTPDNSFLFPCEISLKLNNHQRVIESRYKRKFNAQNVCSLIKDDYKSKSHHMTQIHSSFYYSNLINWYRHLEMSSKIECTNSDKALRMIVLEIETISNHLNFILKNVYILNAYELINPLERFRDEFRKLIDDLFDSSKVSNNKFALPFSFSLPNNWITSCSSLVSNFDSFYTTHFKKLIESKALYAFLNMGKISKDKAIELNFSGVNLKSSGVKFDFKKSSEEYFYSEIDCEVFYGEEGSTYDRLKQRIIEVSQSYEIIQQVITYLPVQTKANLQSDLKLDGTFYSVHPSINGRTLLFSEFKDNQLKNLEISTPSQSCFKGMSHYLLGMEMDEIIPTLTSLCMDPFELDL